MSRITKDQLQGFAKVYNEQGKAELYNKLRNDKDIAIAAITQNKKSLSYISDELKADEDILKILNPPE